MVESQVLSQEFLDNVKLSVTEASEGQNITDCLGLGLEKKSVTAPSFKDNQCITSGQEMEKEVILKEENSNIALSPVRVFQNEEPMVNEEKTNNNAEGMQESTEALPEDSKEDSQLLAVKIGDLEKTVLSLNDVVQKIAGSSEAAAKQLNRVNENLHRENQKLKEGLYDSLTMPILKDLIALESDIQMNIDRCRKKGEEDAAKELEGTLEDIGMILEKHNVEVYRPQEGTPYEPIVQKIVKTVDTTEEQKDRTIAEVRSFGYRFIKGETPIILAPCKVYVYKLNKESV